MSFLRAVATRARSISPRPRSKNRSPAPPSNLNNSDLPEPVVFDFEEHQYLLPQFVEIHVACIEQDKLVAQFLPPLNHPRLATHWATHAQHTRSGAKRIIMQLAPGENGVDELAGFVMLVRDPTETGRARGDVRYLLVSPNHRRKGVAARVMSKLEDVAKGEEVTKLLLATEEGTAAAKKVYPALNYTKLCVIPDWCVSPENGREINQTVFFKDLAKVPSLGESSVTQS